MQPVKQVYTSVACNRTPEIVDWNKHGLMCFGAANAVVIYDTHLRGQDPLTVCSHHESRVNTVRWLTKPDGSCTELISGAADSTAIIWSLNDEGWEVDCVLKGHMDGVTCIYGMYTGGNDLLVLTASIDSTVKVWERSNGAVTLKQTINLNGLCLTMHATMLPVVNKPILFLGLDDNKIHLFTLNGMDYHRIDTFVGHDDWVRGMDSIIDDNTILLASASQDTYIRLWRIQQFDDEPCCSATGIKVEKKIVQAYDVVWTVKLEALLAGHEGWVYGIQWDHFTVKDNKKPIHRLLSSSLDRTIVVWEPTIGGAWMERIRVGEVGGNGLGFYGSRFGPNAFMAHGYNGSFHIWQFDEELQTCGSCIVVGGHFWGVEDVQWEGRGRYLLSASLDQTVRLHAPWKMGNDMVEWHEIGRPQVHGYDMRSVAPLGPGLYASAAEEKVIRVFQAPGNFLSNFHNITGQELPTGGTGPEGASVPSLGLSNKAVFSGDDMNDADADNDGYFVPIEIYEPPTEETLMTNTLWPETRKLYGHGHEVYCVAGSPDGTLLASAARATTAHHAAVLIWETKNWQQIQRLVAHQLTVTQLEFSPDSHQLLSVSRDRRWTLYTRGADDQFTITANTDKANGVHARIIWCCAWFADGQGFATGSRDGKVCVWSKTNTTTETSLKEYALLGEPLAQPHPTTALAFAPSTKTRIIAVGLHTGSIQIYTHDEDWTLRHLINRSMGHHLTVTRLSFKPRMEEDTEYLLASAGSDHLVRVHGLPFDDEQT